MASDMRLPANGHDEEFLEAQTLFFSALSDNERAQFKSCESPEQLLEEVKKLSRFKGEKSTWKRPFECVKKFSDSLTPYFEIIGIFTQSNPEWSAIAWGVLRLILQLAHNFTSFFDKLTEILDQIGRTIPRYKELRVLASEDLSARLRLSLIDLYRDLFEFFTSVARVFTQKSGKLRRTPVVISQLLWKPFSLRYSNFLKRLEFHSTILDDEENLIRTKTLFQVKKSQDETLQRAEGDCQSYNEYKQLVHVVNQKVSAAEFKNICDSVNDWLGMPSSDEIQEPLWDAQNLRESNTGTWIFYDNRFVNWNESDTGHSEQCDALSNMLWVRGNPGTGKSVLAASVLDWLTTSYSHGEGQRQVVGYFFFSFRSSPTRRRFNAYREILSQIFRQLQEDVAALDCFTFAATKSVTSYASIKDLLALLKLLAQQIPRLTLLLDGLDESDDPDDLIKSLATCFSGTPAKIIVFSRPNVKTLLSAPSVAQLNLVRTSVEDDIRQYLSHRLEDLRENKLPLDCSKDAILAHLLDSANGMFLWARLMMDYLESPALDPPETRLATIWKTTRHESLTDMYTRILRLMAKKIEPDRDLARRILNWLAFHARTLDAGELWEAMYCLTTPSPSPGLTDHIIPSPKQAEEFDNVVVMLCTALAERHGPGYRLVHQSVVEFFWTWSEQCDDPEVLQFLLEPAEAHCLLANACLSYLVTRIPAQPLSGDMREGIPKQRIYDGFPLAKYACLYWTRHLKECLVYIKDAIQTGFQHSSPSVIRAFLDLISTLSTFLTNKLFANTWVELQYMVCSHKDLSNHIDDLGEWCQLMNSLPQLHLPDALREISTKIKYLHKDMLELNSAWGPTLEESPHYIWNDVTAFQESSSFMKTSAVTVRSMAPSQFDQTLASKPLVSLSKEQAGGGMSGVLSIWPPRSFEEAWPSAKESRVEDLVCEGWIARFEVWDVHEGAKNKVNDFRIPLNSAEVKYHVDQSVTLRKVLEGRTNRTTPTISNKWSMSFPVAISSNIDLLIILKTAYSLDLLPNKSLRDIRLPGAEWETKPAVETNQKIRTRRPPQMYRLRESLRLSQSYSFLISEDSRYILRLDARCLVSTYVGEPTVYAATAIGLCKISKSSHVIGQVGGHDGDMNINSCSIHPTLPLALFFTRNLGGGRSMMLWAFTANNGASASSKRESLSIVGPPQTGIENLQFSLCGTNIIVKCTGNRLPDVYSIRTHPVYILGIQLHRADHMAPSPEGTHSTEVSWPGNSKQSLLAPKQQIHSGQALIRHSSTYQINLSKQQNSNHLELSKVSGNSKISQHLVSIPNSWTDFDRSVDVALSSSSDANQSIKVVMNQGHKSWYDPTEAHEMHFPIIVEKDPRAFLPAEARSFGGGRKRDASEMLEFSAVLLGDAGGRDPPKQRLIEHGINVLDGSRVESLYVALDDDTTREA